MLADRPILIVDDCEEDAEALRRSLHDAGINTYTKVCLGGKQALDYLFGGYAETPWLLFTELHMRYIDGFELLRRVKRHCITQDVITVVLTRSASYAHFQKAHELGADYCLAKPSPRSGLASLVATFPRSWFGERPLPQLGWPCKSTDLIAARATP